jgi:hypothetical protein
VAGILEAKINQVFLQISAHGSVYEAVKKGGGTYRGIQYGSQEIGVPDLVLFDDLVTKTTLALAFDGSPVSAEVVVSKIRESRKRFLEPQAADYGTQMTRRSWDVPETAGSCAG